MWYGLVSVEIWQLRSDTVIQQQLKGSSVACEPRCCCLACNFESTDISYKLALCDDKRHAARVEALDLLHVVTCTRRAAQMPQLETWQHHVVFPRPACMPEPSCRVDASRTVMMHTGDALCSRRARLCRAQLGLVPRACLPWVHT